MNEEKDMVCHTKTNDSNEISNLFWGKFKLETQNTNCDGCNIESMLNYDGIVLPIGLYYLQNLNVPKLNYEVKETPVQDDLLKILFDMNNDNGGRVKKTTANTNAILTKKFTRRSTKTKKNKTRRKK